MEWKAPSPAVRITIIYMVVASTWIIGSDSVLELVAPGIVWLQSSKGLLFVLATGTLLYSMLRTDIGIREKADAQIRYQARLLEHMSDAIISTDMNFNVQSFNASAERLYGWKADEMIGKPFGDLVQNQYEGTTRTDALKQFVETGEWSGEVNQKRKDGSRIYCQAAVSYVTNSAGERVGVVSVNRDITKRKQAEQALHESEQRYQSLFENMLDGIAYCQMEFKDGRPHDFVYLHVNDAFERLTGLTHVVGKRVSEVIPGIQKTDPELIEIYGRVAQTGQPERFETYLGALKIWFSVAVYSPAKGYFVAIFDNITERKQLERELLLTQFSIDHASIGIMRTGAEAQVLSVNDHYCQMLGYTAEELRGMHVYDIDPKFPLKRWKQHRSHLRKSGSNTFETVHRRKDGTTFPVEITGTYVVFQGQEFAISFIHDITERKRAEEEIQSLAKFPSENPDLIVRVTTDGVLLYANNASLSLLPDWHLEPGKVVPEVLRNAVSFGLKIGLASELEVAYDEKIYSFHVAPIQEAGYANLYGRDITKRKQAEQQLRESQEKFSTAFRSSAVAMAITTLDGIYVEVNQAFCDLSGYSYTEVLGRNSRELHLLDPEVRQRLVEIEQANNRALHNVEFGVHTKNGENRDILLSLEIISLDGTPHQLSTMLDITERKQAEEQIQQQAVELVAALQQKNEAYTLLDTLMSTAPIGMAFIDCDLRYLRINTTLAEVNGIPAADHLGHTVRELLPELAAVVEPIFRRVIETRQPSINLEIRGETPRSPGEQRHWLASYYPVIAHDGTMLGVGLNVLEITERKRAEDALRDSEERFRALFENMTEGAAIHELVYDEKGHPIDYIVVDANPAFYTHTGISREAAIGKRASRLYATGQPPYFDIYAKVAMTGQPVRFETYFGSMGKDFGISACSTGAGRFATLFEDITERKRAEERLRKESRILDMAHVMICDLDSHIVFWNSGAEKLYGWTKDEALGQISHVLLKTVSPMSYEEIVAILHRDGEWQGEIVHTCRDGSTVTVASHWVLYHNEKGEPEGVLETNNDITALKAAENCIKKMNRIYAVLSSINEVIVRVREPQDLFERACEIAVEKGGFKMAWIGLRDPETGELTVAAHSHGIDKLLEKMVANFNTEEGRKLPLMVAIQTGEPTIINDVQHDPRIKPVRAKAIESGSRSLAAFPIRVAGAVRGVFALYSGEPGFFDDEEAELLTDLVQDISFALDIAQLDAQRRETEQRLYESQARLQSTLDHMMEGCQIIDFDWRYHYLNDTAAEHGRMEKENLLGRTMMEAYPGIETTSMFANLKKCMASRHPERMVNEFAYPDGTSRWFDLSIQPVPEGLFILSTDITARKQAEDELRRLNAELEERVAERTAQLEIRTKELESFSYSVSHDLKAPLRGIDGYSRLLVTEHVEQLDEEGREFVANIRKGAQQMSQLIDDLLAYSRLERRTIDVEYVNPQSLAEALIAEHRDDLQQYTVDINIPCTDVSADPDGLAMALRNLIANAIKFTATVTKPAIEIGGRADGELCVIWVRDNGIGFDMKFHDRIFDIFQRLHRVEDYPGTGIGLAIVRKAMERMGGRVWAESEPEHGATFYLELPRK